MKKINTILQNMLILIIIFVISVCWIDFSYGAKAKCSGDLVVSSPPTFTKTVKNNQLIINIDDVDGIDEKDIKIYKYKQGSTVKQELKDSKLITHKVVKTQNRKNISYQYTLTKQTISDSSNLFLLSVKNKLGYTLETEILVKKAANGQYTTNNAPKFDNFSLKNNSKVDFSIRDGGKISKAIIYDLNNNGRQILYKTNLASSSTLSLNIANLKEDAAKTSTYKLKLYLEDQKAQKTTSTFSFQLTKTTRTVDKRSVSLPIGDRIYFLDAQYQEKTGELHGGDAIIIESQGHFGLIDAGRAVTHKRLVQNLVSLGITHLDFVLLTHSHADHVKGYKWITMSKSGRDPGAGVTIGKLYIGNYTTNKNLKSTDMAENIKNMQEVLNATPKSTQICYVNQSQNQTIKLGNFTFKLYNTTLHNTTDDNENSIVALATVNGRKIYFEGDLQGSQRLKIAKQVGKVDVLKVAHHGKYSNATYKIDTDTFKVLQPAYAIFTNYDRNNSNKKIVTALNATTRNKNYFTAKGSTILTIDSSGNMNFKQLADQYNYAD